MRRLLARTDLVQGPSWWIPKLGKTIRHRRDLHTLPELIRDVAYAVAIDTEIRAGGFALYFFNPACTYVFDTYYALEHMDAGSAELLASALRRVGTTHVVDLDIVRLSAEDPAALGAAYGRLIDIVTRAREGEGSLDDCFARFKAGLDPDLGQLAGLASLSERWCARATLHDTIAEIVLANRFEFLD